MKGVHEKQTDVGDHETIEARRGGDLIFAGNPETGEVAGRGSGAWIDFCKLKKSTARKLAEEFLKRSVELWVEAAEIPDHVERIVANRLPGIVHTLLAERIDKVADEILEKIIREKLTDQLRGSLTLDFDIHVEHRNGPAR